MYSDEKGQAMPLIALLTVVLFGFAALVFDVGLMANSRSSLQKTADAAALAAAMELPTHANAITTAIHFVERNEKAYPSAKFTVSVEPIDASKRVRVTISENVEHFFAKVLNINSTTINATAVAEQYKVWDGFALPFINVNENYLPYVENSGQKFTLWDKNNANGSPGNFEIISSEEILSAVTEPMDINWADGITLKQGNVGNYDKNYVAPIVEKKPPYVGYTGPYYCFSLNSTLINEANNYSNGQVIPVSQMVLLEFSAVYTNGEEGANLWVFGDLIKVYDLSKGEIPMDVKYGRIKSRLVE